jgi:hypothetical protein
VAGGRPRGQERRSRGRHQRRHEVIDRHIGKRGAVRVRVCDQVEGDVDPSGDCISMPVHRFLVERVDLPISAAPPAERTASATSSSVARVRPARNTLAPSRAKAAPPRRRSIRRLDR